MPRTNGSVFKVFDLERVEVLRGPQGTLFGRNSEGGAIRLVTKQPGQEFDAYLKANLGNFSHQDFIGMVNLPVNDELALRVQAAHLKEDGFVHRGPQLMGGETDTIARVQAAWSPHSNLKFTFGALYSEAKSNGSPNVFKSCDMSPGINGPSVDPAVAIQGNYGDWVSDWLAAAGQPRLATVNDPRLVRGDYLAPDYCFLDDANPDWDAACAQHNDSKYYQYDVRMAWDITDNVKLSLTSGYAKMDHAGVTDWQYLGTENRPDIVKSRVINHEALLNAALFGGGIDSVTGLNYFEEESDTDASNITARGTSLFNATTGGSANTNAWAGTYVVANQASRRRPTPGGCSAA